MHEHEHETTGTASRSTLGDALEAWRDAWRDALTLPDWVDGQADPLYLSHAAIVVAWAGPTTDRRLRDTVREAGSLMGPDAPEDLRVDADELGALVAARDAADRVMGLMGDALDTWSSFLPAGQEPGDGEGWWPETGEDWRALEACARSVVSVATGGAWTAVVGRGLSRGPRLVLLPAGAA